MHWNRRDFLKTGTLLFTGLGMLGLRPSRFLLTPNLAQSATPPEEHYGLMLLFSGAWDTTLSLDPWVHETRFPDTELFIEYRTDELIQAENLILGPAMAAMKHLAREMCIVNGLVMRPDETGHFQPFKDVMAGEENTTKPSLFAQIAAQQQEHNLGVFSHFALAPDPTGVRTLFFRDLANLREIDDVAAWAEALADSESKTPLNSGLQEIRNFQPIYDKLSEFVRSTPEDIDLSGWKAVSQLIPMLFRHGASRFVTADLTYDGNNLDTHSGHEKTHLKHQASHWEKVANLVQDLKKIPNLTGDGSLYDRTTILVTSEFSRTAYLNSSRGKDHNPFCNSFLLMGKGVRGNQTLGGSRFVSSSESITGFSYVTGMPMNLQTGQAVFDPSLGGEKIRPRHLGRLVGEIFGMPASPIPLIAQALKT